MDMLMKIEDAVKYLKDFLPDYLKEKSLPLNKKFKCLNPEHDDVYGSMDYFEDAKRVRCFECEAHYDLLDLIGLDYGIPDFMDRLRFAANKYGVELEDDRQRLYKEKKERGVAVVEDSVPKARKPEDVIADSRKHTGMAVEYLEGRGIDDGLVRRLGIGYDYSFFDSFNRKYWNA
jgi:DNA primase